MSLQEAKQYLDRQARRFALARLTEVKLLALGLGLLSFALVRLIDSSRMLPLSVGILVFAIVVILRIRRTGALRWSALKVSLYLNANFPELKDSADLLASDKSATSLEEVQRQHVLQALVNVKARVQAPHRIAQGLLLFATGITAVVLLPAAARRSSELTPVNATDTTASVMLQPALSGIELLVTPPAYTGVRPFSSVGGNFKVPAGSKLTWKVRFSGSPISPALIFASEDSLSLVSREADYQASGRAEQPAFYQVTWRDASGKRYASDYFHADTREDAAPVVAVVGRQQFQTIGPGEPTQIVVNASASDDYTVKDAHLIATVSKGSGEGIKFREVTLSFDNAQFPAQHATLKLGIDLGQLGLEPGDELYFYAEAIDNRMPVPNLSRTETFFIALKDTAEAVAVADAGLGIDLMPDYFRSQRQLIIDTEKLLAEQRKIKKSDFNFRSNELGFDQKALRLKYGQFLGMEDEAGIGVVEPAAEEEGEEDPTKKFGHQHDKENEHNLVEEKKTAKEPDHQHEGSETEGVQEDPMKAFLHQHDSEDEATFFIQSVKAKLQAALTLMWDSELHLRMYEPKKSLPYQYRILALLKEIAQDNRAYVHRTGFDAPPIKEDRRLTGELEDAAGTTEQVAALTSKPFPAIQKALPQIEYLIGKQTPLSTSSRNALEQAGYEVVSEALKQPGKYMRTLSALRKLMDGSVDPLKMDDMLRAIRRDLWSILPVETYSPTRERRALHPLDQEVLELMNNQRE